MCSNSLLSNANLLTKVYFPRAILPAAVALSGLLDFAVSTVCLGALLIYYRVMPDWHILLWFPLTLLLVLFTYSLGMILAALAVRYRDVKYATPFVIQLGLFVTPVIYPLNIIPKQYRSFLALNPLTGIIESFRSTLVSSQSVQWDLLGVSVFVTALMFIVGFLYFNRAEQHFADLA
jgi:lipopolysaccharide transport system permease protein